GKLLGGNAGSNLYSALVTCRIGWFVVRSPPDLGPGSPHDGIRRFEGGTCTPHQPDGEPAGGSTRALFANPREAERGARVRHALGGGPGRIRERARGAIRRGQARGEEGLAEKQRPGESRGPVLFLAAQAGFRHPPE